MFYTSAWCLKRWKKEEKPTQLPVFALRFFSPLTSRLCELKAARTFDCSEATSAWRQSGACTAPAHEVHEVHETDIRQLSRWSRCSFFFYSAWSDFAIIDATASLRHINNSNNLPLFSLWNLNFWKKKKCCAGSLLSSSWKRQQWWVLNFTSKPSTASYWLLYVLIPDWMSSKKVEQCELQQVCLISCALLSFHINKTIMKLLLKKKVMVFCIFFLRL